MSDLDEKRLAVVIKALRDMGNDIFGHKEDAAAILAALDAYDAADAREAVTEDDVNRTALPLFDAGWRGEFGAWGEQSPHTRARFQRMAHAALEYAAPLLARRARALMPAAVTEEAVRAAQKVLNDALSGFESKVTFGLPTVKTAIEAALAAAPRDPQPAEAPAETRHLTLAEQRMLTNALRRAGRPADPQPVEHVGIGMTDKSAPTPPAALREVASTARTLARLSPANLALAKFAEAVAKWAQGQP